MSHTQTPRKLQPLLLRSDNFTPPARTPWGGTKIAHKYKRLSPLIVGESWEVSTGPELPCVVEHTGELLEHALGGRASLVVKLLDAADDLSVQIHPPDDYAGLGEDEGGKPESWYIVEREPGAGVFVGLRGGVSRAAMRAAVEASANVSGLLYFVAVEPGDFFVIDAGTPHAIGRGVTLVEPAYLVPGRRGLTYRYWDWGRRYDSNGQQSPAGKPRELHVEHALAVTCWDTPRGSALLDRIRVRAGAVDPASRGRVERLCAPSEEDCVQSAWLDVRRLVGTGEVRWPACDALWAITVMGGSVRLLGDGDSAALDVACGRSAVLPAGLGPLTVQLDHCHAILACALTA